MELPPPEDGDILAIHDTGAYTMSMYCKWVIDFHVKDLFYPLLCFFFFLLGSIQSEQAQCMDTERLGTTSSLHASN